MQDSNLPAKMPVKWAANAPTGDVNAIPLSSQIGVNPGYASLPDGFVPLNFTPVQSGGVPPRGADVNGILQWITAWLQWGQAGGPITWDSSFGTSIGGYPKGAVVASATTFGTFWLSTTDNNTSNPDTGGAGWLGFRLGEAPGNYYVDTGVANALVITPTVIPAAYVAGLSYRVKPVAANTGATTINVGGLGAVAITNPDGSPLVGGEIAPGAILELCYQGSGFQLINSSEWVANIVSTQFRARLNAPLTLYVSTTGNDATGNGSVGAPFATIAKAYQALQYNYDLNGQQVTIQLQDGTYTFQTVLSGLCVGQYSPTQIVIQGNTTTPANTTIAYTGGSGADCFQVTYGCQVTIASLYFNVAANVRCIAAHRNGIIFTNSCVFGPAAAHLYATNNGLLIVNGGYTISGGGITHCYSQWSGRIIIPVSGSLTITLTGTPAFSTGFAYATSGGNVTFGSVTFSGGATGPRYYVNMNAVVDSQGGGASFLPGNSSGSTATGGQYI